MSVARIERIACKNQHNPCKVPRTCVTICRDCRKRCHVTCKDGCVTRHLLPRPRQKMLRHLQRGVRHATSFATTAAKDTMSLFLELLANGRLRIPSSPGA